MRSSGAHAVSAARHRAGLVLYVLLVVTLTLVHEPIVLAAGLLGIGLCAGRDLPAVARRSLLATLWFAGTVSISYAIAGWLREEFSGTFLLRLNLRMLCLTSLTFLVPRRINLFAALSRPPELQQVLLLAYGQIMTFRRIMQEFTLALRSRSLAPPRWRDHYRQRAAMAAFFLEKSLRNSQEITQAMSSRGYFLDHD